jgi:hypothetical protein
MVLIKGALSRVYVPCSFEVIKYTVDIRLNFQSKYVCNVWSLDIAIIP